ncbi:Down syndrome cell adhesion molecule-like [Tropilaelaps mercedesae]|uniref:Down syndrome cell adhesion molecule-like n=1 Tax=Tropilaelaps mercedesae TaxID=418985 RepID=A0A1V9XR33_9ACAR|nr:Down syndrome cell adhesion molecule-like [Tropilaelaps mercedesae]
MWNIKFILLPITVLCGYSICISFSIDMVRLDRMQDVRAKAGRTIRFMCGLSAGEDVQFSWTHNNNVIPKNSIKFEILSGTESTVLIVRKVASSDTGLYTCIAKNRWSEDRTSATLKVEGQ